MKDIELGKSYYIITNDLTVALFICHIKVTYDDTFFYFKKTKTFHNNFVSLMDGFFKTSKTHRECKKFVGYKEFMKEYRKAKRDLLIREIIE